MKRTRFTAEQIIMDLRKTEVMVSQGKSILGACGEISICEQAHCRRRDKYGNMSTSDAEKPKGLEKENGRSKRIVAGLSIDNAVLKEVAGGKC